MNIDQRIAALEAELHALKAARPAPPPPPARDVEGARVIQLNNEITSGLPSLDQLRRLFSIVRTRVPQAKTHDDDAPFRGFCGAYRFVANCGRVAALNNKHSLGWWCDEMKSWLRARDSMTMDLNGSSFIAAVLASGDILYAPYDATRGFVWAFGIMPPQHGGKPASPDGWRRVLEGSVLAPSQPARQVRVVSY